MGNWLQSLLGWYGGKYQLLDYILPFPVHTTFVEVFGGSSVVLFNKIKSSIEIVNDINSRLINLWKTIQLARREFVDYCKNEGGIDSRAIFDEYKDNVTDNKIEDAFRLYYVNHHSFSQMNNAYHGMSFTGKEQWHNPYLNKLEDIDRYYQRIKHVAFECQDFRKIIRRADREDTLIYLDPPYFKGGEVYEMMAGIDYQWTMKDFEDLRDILADVKHAKWVLSVDNDEFFTDKMDWLFVKPITRVNAASLSVGKEKSRSTEYVIRNFNPKLFKTMRDVYGKDKIKDDMEL